MSHEPRKPLRVWPGVAAALLLLIVRILVPLAAPQAAIYGILGALVGALAIIVWWLFFSRAPWVERLGAMAFMILALVATYPFVHRSISTGMMGRMLPVFGTPFLTVALVAGVAASRHRSSGVRRVSIAVAILLACGALTLVRTSGVRGEGGAELHWRWTPTSEERLLARGGDEPIAPKQLPPAPPPAEIPKEPPSPAAASAPAPSPTGPAAAKPAPGAPAAATTEAEWAGFRGPRRDSIISGDRIATDWTASPPVEMWRRPIGPGWSSFAVAGDLVYTQEQRGDDEVVSCYRLTTGEPVWRHRDRARFWESNGGPGPRATPTVSNGRVYTHGATGIVNALDGRNGAVVWSRNAATDTGAKMPGWGFAGSPLVVNDVVIVAASGRLVAYDVSTGSPRWRRQTRGGGYSSPHLATIDGVPQILLLSGGGVTSVASADGALLWEHTWAEGVGIVQPALVADGGVLIAAGDMMGGVGIRRLAVGRGPGGWKVNERWTSRGLKPYFNDFVIHKGHAFGFDGSILSCIDIADGTRKWKGGRYGSGQLLLLRDQDLLLVVSEEGELALVKAAPDGFTEIARFKALEGKTWNHPALVGDVLLVRNGEEIAAFRLAGAEATE